MSDIFFDEMEIPKPKYNLAINGLSHGAMTGQMLQKIEAVLLKEKPNLVVVYGDTNSTLAGALTASKLQIPLVHIEAGMRSFNKAMPEELNRIITDHSSTLLFGPTKTAIKNLAKEGFSLIHSGSVSIDNPRVYHCGDIMLDNSLYFSEIAKRKSNILSQLNLSNIEYIFPQKPIYAIRQTMPGLYHLSLTSLNTPSNNGLASTNGTSVSLRTYT